MFDCKIIHPITPTAITHQIQLDEPLLESLFVTVDALFVLGVVDEVFSESTVSLLLKFVLSSLDSVFSSIVLLISLWFSLRISSMSELKSSSPENPFLLLIFYSPLDKAHSFGRFFITFF